LVLEKDYKEVNNGMQAINLTAPNLTASGYLVADLDSSQIFMAKEPQTIYPGVGTNKLLTGIAASEALRLSFDPNLTDKLYINEKMLLPPGETAGLTIGKKFTFFDLYYPLLIEHSNDASEALALRLSRNYLSILRERVRSLGMDNTIVVDSYGSENGNFSTAEDLFYLLRYLFNNRLWMLNISKGQIYNDFGKLTFTQLENKNLFSDDPNFIGGFTEPSSLGLSTSLFVFKFNLNGAERNVGIILIGSADVLKDVQSARSYLDKIYF
jgi:D-alanyl-D-alanine carboxypeptidase